MNRITPSLITELKTNEIFCFGSNEAGIMGAGAALQAYRSFGAKNGLGFGPYGRTFAIPTKDWNIEKLHLYDIKFYIDRFVAYTYRNPRLTFLVTQIGCGLAGYTPEQIAPLFRNATEIENIHLPVEFWNILNKTKI